MVVSVRIERTITTGVVAKNDSMTTTNTNKIEEFQTLFEQAILDIAAKTTKQRLCLILSGGVDTCAILQAATKVGVTFAAAFTVCCCSSDRDDVVVTSPDRDFAIAAAKQHELAIHHYIINITPNELIEQYLSDCIKTLHCYDGMTLRNSLVVAAAFQKASTMGFTDAIIGDAADELFGGYSFMWGNDNDDPALWKKKRNDMCRHWTFATSALAKLYNLTSHSPYMSPTVVEWALNNVERSDCIGTRPIQLTYTSKKIPHLTGKLLLRQAYDTVASWRRKDPIEVGSGVTVIGKDDFWKFKLSDDEFHAEIKGLQSRGFIITSKENVFNFRIFEQCFGHNGQNLPTAKRLEIGQGCFGCCFDIGTEKMFCHICGAYPAQRSANGELDNNTVSP